MRVFSRILYWMAYSVILSMMPVAIGYLSAMIFEYDFNKIDALADILITDFCLAATLIRDTAGGGAAGNVIRFIMLLECLLASVFFGHIMIVTGLGRAVSMETEKALTLLVAVLLVATVIFGILSMILIPENTDET